jgi:hypothetical protein
VQATFASETAFLVFAEGTGWANTYNKFEPTRAKSDMSTHCAELETLSD